MKLKLPANVEIKKWLTLLQAARILGVHPATLRRWADAGEIPFLLTPGGHRRFAEAEIHKFEQERSGSRRGEASAQKWADLATVHTRQELRTHPDMPWLQKFSEPEREAWRSLGRRLMGLIMNYISIKEGGEALVDEAGQIGKEYARLTLAVGLPVSMALQAALFFRDTVVETALVLPENARLHPDGNVHILKRISAILNAVEVAIAESYGNL